MPITSLREALKDLAQSLQMATIFPAALLVLININFILPLLPVAIPLDTDSPTGITLIVSVTLVVSYTFYAFNFPLIRFFEGRDRWEQWGVMRWLKELRIAEYRQLLKQNNKVRLDRHYPSTSEEAVYGHFIHGATVEKRIRPTLIGNIIAAFEDYPQTRYGMDSVVLWPRLVPLLKEKNYLEFVAQEKGVFDFLMNTCVGVGILGFEFACLGMYWGSYGWVALVAGATLIGCWGLYKGMEAAALQWGLTVRTAFDLYRRTLYERLGIVRVYKFEEEVVEWKRVSIFLRQRDFAGAGSLFIADPEEKEVCQDIPRK